jgi:hypothetical protein
MSRDEEKAIAALIRETLLNSPRPMTSEELKIVCWSHKLITLDSSNYITKNFGNGRVSSILDEMINLGVAAYIQYSGIRKYFSLELGAKWKP